MNIHDGLVVEKDISSALDNHKYSELSCNMQHLIKRLFPSVNDNSIISSETLDDVCKADLRITCDGNAKTLSVKSGKAEILHNEILDKFLTMLEENGISKTTIDTLRLYHFGDGTLDGTGKSRMSYNQVMVKYEKEIATANYELNTNREFVKSVVNRCMFDGAFEEYTKADAIYVGNLEFGILATKKQVNNHVERKYYSYYKMPHIGPLLLRPDARYSQVEIKDERKRNRIVAYWPSLSREIEYIGNRYDYF